MRIAVVGLGDIAQKAYLPILGSRDDIELVLCTRNASNLQHIAQQYRIAVVETDFRKLAEYGVQAAFVHTATASHALVVETLLRLGIDVYVDKPISDNAGESQQLVDLAQALGRILMTGFNRRFAPMYRQLSALPERHSILMQKNRLFQPATLRQFVFDDFIHVVDTLRFLAGGPVKEMSVKAKIVAGMTYHIALQLSGDNYNAIGIMNRDSGSTEETLEVMCPGHKWHVEGMQASTHFVDGEEIRSYAKDWDSHLHRRGFPQIIEHFIACVRTRRTPEPGALDSMETHALCEKIVLALEPEA